MNCSLVILGFLSVVVGCSLATSTEAYTLKGSVVDSNGDALKGVEIRVSLANSTPPEVAQSAEDGTYSMELPFDVNIVAIYFYLAGYHPDVKVDELSGRLDPEEEQRQEIHKILLRVDEQLASYQLPEVLGDYMVLHHFASNDPYYDVDEIKTRHGPGIVRISVHPDFQIWKDQLMELYGLD